MTIGILGAGRMGQILTRVGGESYGAGSMRMMVTSNRRVCPASG